MPKGPSRAGRKKIDIRFLEDAKKRKITLNKRKNGLMKKAYELSILCGCEVALVIFDSDQKLYSYGSRSVDKTVKKWENMKKRAVTAWTNTDFNEDKGKFRTNGKEDDADDDEEDEEEDYGGSGQQPADLEPMNRTRSFDLAFPAAAAASAAQNGRAPKRSLTMLPSLTDMKAGKKHSNPRKAALQRGTFSIPTTTSSQKNASSGKAPLVQPVLTPSLAAAVGLPISSGAGYAAQNLMELGTADITVGGKSSISTRSTSSIPAAGVEVQPTRDARDAPFTAGFNAAATSNSNGDGGLSPWLMSAVSSLSNADDVTALPSSLAFTAQSSGMGLTPPITKAGETPKLLGAIWQMEKATADEVHTSSSRPSRTRSK